jgi:hypothetical protein
LRSLLEALAELRCSTRGEMGQQVVDGETGSPSSFADGDGDALPSRE